jgi:hypothetical protein
MPFGPVNWSEVLPIVGSSIGICLFSFIVGVIRLRKRLKARGQSRGER